MANQLYVNTWARVMANTIFDPEKGCWLWTGQTSSRKPDSPNVYPQMSMRVAGRHKTIRVHRWVAEHVTRRKLAWNITIEHLCANSLCVSPNHFGLASNEDNVRARHERVEGRSYGAVIMPLFEENWIGVRRDFAHVEEPIPF